MTGHVLMMAVRTPLGHDPISDPLLRAIGAMPTKGSFMPLLCASPSRSRCTVASIAVASIAAIVIALPGRAMSAGSNAMQVVVASGPVGGTYRIDAKRVLCISTANGIAASFKYFDVPDKNKPGVNMRVHNPKTMSEAQIVVDNPTDAGAKRGSLELTFGNRSDHPIKYLAFAPDGGTLTQTAAGSGFTFAFAGHTKDGVRVTATAVCRDIMKL